MSDGDKLLCWHITGRVDHSVSSESHNNHNYFEANALMVVCLSGRTH